MKVREIDISVCERLQEIIDGAERDGATWYRIEVKLWYGQEKRTLTREGGKSKSLRKI
jgi:hypothetical protein